MVSAFKLLYLLLDWSRKKKKEWPGWDESFNMFAADCFSKATYPCSLEKLPVLLAFSSTVFFKWLKYLVNALSCSISQQQDPVQQRYKELLVVREQLLKKLEELQIMDSSTGMLPHVSNSSTPSSPVPVSPRSQTTLWAVHIWILVALITLETVKNLYMLYCSMLKGCWIGVLIYLHVNTIMPLYTKSELKLFW